MVWNCVSVVVTILMLCNSMVAGQNAMPWSSPGMAQAFMSNFLQAAYDSSFFSGQQMSDMSDVGETMIDSMQRLVQSGKSSRHVMQALNTGFASSIVDILVTDATQDLSTLTSVIADCMSRAFLNTTGSVNAAFINEIIRLVGMFAQTSATSYSAGMSQSGYSQQQPVAATGQVPQTVQTGYSQQLPVATTGQAPQTVQTGYSQQLPVAATGQAPQTVQTGYSQQFQSQSTTVPVNTAYGSLTNTPLRNEVLNSASRLSSQPSVSRISSAVANMLPNGAFDAGSLPNVISNLSSSVRADNPEISGCEVLVQVLLEVMSALTHIVSSSTIGPVNPGASQSYSSIVGQQVASVLG